MENGNQGMLILFDPLIMVHEAMPTPYVEASFQFSFGGHCLFLIEEPKVKKYGVHVFYKVQTESSEIFCTRKDEKLSYVFPCRIHGLCVLLQKDTVKSPPAEYVQDNEEGHFVQHQYHCNCPSKMTYQLICTYYLPRICRASCIQLAQNNKHLTQRIKKQTYKHDRLFEF